jgi:hypothetical protein
MNNSPLFSSTKTFFRELPEIVKKKNRTFQEFNIILPRILKLITIVPKEDDEGFLVCAKNSVTSLVPPHYLTIIETETGPNENLSLLLYIHCRVLLYKRKTINNI